MRILSILMSIPLAFQLHTNTHIYKQWVQVLGVGDTFVAAAGREDNFYTAYVNGTDIRVGDVVIFVMDDNGTPDDLVDDKVIGIEIK